MADSRSPAPDPFVCPHCRKPFDAEPIESAEGRFRSFKCPNCRLLVPTDRVREPAAE